MAYTKYEPIGFENGTLVSAGKVNLETGEMTMPVYSGKAPINATNLNHLEQGLVDLEEYTTNLLKDSLDSDSATNAPSIHAVKLALEGTILFNNDAGVKENITLLGDVGNYSYIEIYYNKDGIVYNSKKIDNPNNKQVGLDFVFMETDHTQMVTQQITLQNNEIIYGAGMWNNFGINGGFYNTDHIDEPLIIITKVIGYK